MIFHLVRVKHNNPYIHHLPHTKKTKPPMHKNLQRPHPPSLPPLTIKTYLPQQSPIIHRCPTTQRTPDPCPPLTLRTNPTAARDPLGKQDFCLKDPEFVKHLQKMLVTLGYDLGTNGPDKDGVDGSFGKLTETAVNDFQEKNRDQ